MNVCVVLPLLVPVVEELSVSTVSTLSYKFNRFSIIEYQYEYIPN